MRVIFLIDLGACFPPKTWQCYAFSVMTVDRHSWPQANFRVRVSLLKHGNALFTFEAA